MIFTEHELRGLTALRAVESGLLRLKWLSAATRFEIAMRGHDRALKLAYKAGFDPNQPRTPAGNPGGGRWTALTNETGKNDLPEVPQDKPKLPSERPKTSRERVATYKTVARWLGRYGGSLGKLVDGLEWLREQSPTIQSYNDPPKSLDQLQRNVYEPGLGYDIHHIVEQTQAEKAGFSRQGIDAPENLVRIPRMKHWEINAWYQTESPDYGGQTPREYLEGRNWDVRRRVGLEALKKFGVLEP